MKFKLAAKFNKDIHTTCGLFIETLTSTQLFPNSFHAALEVKLYYDCKTSRCCNRCNFCLTTCGVLRHATPFFLHLLGINQSLMLSQYSNQATGV